MGDFAKLTFYSNNELMKNVIKKFPRTGGLRRIVCNSCSLFGRYCNKFNKVKFKNIAY